MPEIVVNGKIQQVLSTSIEQLIVELELDGKRFAIEINQAIVPRGQFHSTAIRDGDKLEVVHFVGGG